MTLMPRKLIAEQSASAKIPAEDLRLALTGLMTPGATANSARSGVLRGSGAPGFLGCQVLAPSASTFTVKQGSFICQQATANGGAYIGVIDSDQTVSISASLPSAGNFKAGYVLAHCYDSAYGDAQDGFQLETVLGTQATSVGAAVYPALPSNSLALTGFTVNSSGSITLTTLPTYTVTAGGILPVITGDTAAGDHDGQWRDEPTAGLQRWNGTSWLRPHTRYLGAGTAFPTSGLQYGDTFLRTDLGTDGGTLWTYTPHATDPWRFAESGALVVSNQAGRDVLSSTGASYTGLQVVQADTGFEWEWNKGNFWTPVTSLAAKAWRGAGFSTTIAPGGSTTIALDTFRLGPGYTSSGNGIVLPMDGFYRIAANSYVTGGGNTCTTVTNVMRTRTSTADTATLRTVDHKTDAADCSGFIVGRLPLKSGDLMWLNFTVGTQGAGGAQYYGTLEYYGVSLELIWDGALNGVTPV